MKKEIKVSKLIGIVVGLGVGVCVIGVIPKVVGEVKVSQEKLQSDCVDIEDVVCEELSMENVDEELKEYMEKAIAQGGQRYLEYKGYTYLVLSDPEGRNIKVSKRKRFNGLLVGYEYDEEATGERYKIIKTNISKENIQVGYGVEQVGVENKTINCAVTEVNEELGEVTIISDEEGKIVLKMKEGVVLKKGVYEIKLDGNEEVEYVHKLGMMDMKANVYEVKKEEDRKQKKENESVVYEWLDIECGGGIFRAIRGDKYDESKGMENVIVSISYDGENFYVN